MALRAYAFGAFSNAEVGSPPHVKWFGQPLDIMLAKTAKTLPHEMRTIFISFISKA